MLCVGIHRDVTYIVVKSNVDVYIRDYQIAVSTFHVNAYELIANLRSYRKSR